MSQKIIDRLNTRKPQFLIDLGCTIMEANAEERFCKMEFNIDKRYCHSIDIIQGGFVTAMLDAVTSHAVFVTSDKLTALSTLELKVSFYEASRAGKLIAIGKVNKMGRSIAFLSGELYNEAGQKTAAITSTAKIRYKN